MFFSSSQGELILIIDVQSSIVRGSLVHLVTGNIPNVLYTHNVGIPYKSSGGSSRLIKMVLRGIEEIIQSVRANIQSEANSEDIPRRISSVHYVLSSPWVVSQAKTISTKFKVETAINRPYIMNMIKEERAKMTSNAVDDIRVIEEKVFDVQLNGYSVTSWESKHTKELGVSFVVSVAGGRMIDRFVEACESIVNHKNHIQFHSSLFLQHVGIQKTMPNSSNYALIHIHEELTDVAIIHSHFCSFFGSYPFGIQHIIRTIAKETKTTEDAAESTLNLITKGEIESTQAKKEFSIVEDMKQKWIGEFKKLLKTSPTPESAPTQIIISAHTYEDFFVKSFRSAYPQSSPEILLIENILPYVGYGSKAERLRLTGLYVIAIHSLLK